MSITADDFIAAIRKFDALTPSLQTDLLAYYLLKHGGSSTVSSASIASLRQALHLRDHGRLSAYLSEQSSPKGRKRGRYVKGGKGYVLERAYSRQLESQYLGRPTARNVAAGLRGTLAAIGDPSVKAYLEEAVAAFEQNLLRSALIMSWCVAYGLFRSWLFRNHLATLNGAMAAWKTPVTISKLDDFQELTEAVVLDTARKIGVITKEQHKTLKALLDQRNSYAHPTPKPISPSATEAYIETVLNEVTPTFG